MNLRLRILVGVAAAIAAAASFAVEPSVNVRVALSKANQLQVFLTNTSRRTVYYRWPIAAHSITRDMGEQDCPELDQLGFESYYLRPDAEKRLTLDGWKESGYVGIFVSFEPTGPWRIAWSNRALP